MNWPYTYNINYYAGDIYQFVIYPKNSDGTQFDLSNKTSLFVISTERGNPESVVVSISPEINTDPSRLLCTILPTQGSFLTGSSYVYDIEIRGDEGEVYTLLTGNISVQQDITP